MDRTCAGSPQYRSQKYAPGKRIFGQIQCNPVFDATTPSYEDWHYFSRPQRLAAHLTVLMNWPCLREGSNIRLSLYQNNPCALSIPVSGSARLSVAIQHCVIRHFYYGFTRYSFSGNITYAFDGVNPASAGTWSGDDNDVAAGLPVPITLSSASSDSSDAVTFRKLLYGINHISGRPRDILSASAKKIQRINLLIPLPR